MKARYIFRLDDITPTMDWGRFWALLRLFQRHRVKPLLGIVPDNQDPKLIRQSPEPHFWETMRLLVARDIVDIAQHGYQHVLGRGPGAAILKPTHGVTVERSEFTGYSFNEQLDRISKGKAILEAEGLPTNYWFAPNHSYDYTTLNALRTAGFTAVSDGISLQPYKHLGLVFIPQQLWRPIWMPTGIFTICLHSNEITNKEIRAIRQFLRTPVSLLSFGSAVRSYKPHRLDGITNSVFKRCYQGARKARRALHWRRSSVAPSPMQPAPQTMPTHADRGSISLL